MFFDLNIKGSGIDNNIKLAMEASKYGWNHINFSYDQNEFLKGLISALNWKKIWMELFLLIILWRLNQQTLMKLESLLINSEIRLPAFLLLAGILR